MPSEETFDQWAIVEIMGHQQIAGRVTEASIGGCAFLRVDVPEDGERQGFTKYFGQGAIYAMTPVDESIARAAAARFRPAPVDPYTMAGIVRQIEHQQDQVGNAEDFNDDPDYDEDGIGPCP